VTRSARNPSRAESLSLRQQRPADPGLSDEALVAACAVDDPAALGLLFDRHAAAVTRFLARLVGERCHDLDDLLQTTFLEGWRAAARYRGRASVRSWLFGIAANLARHHVRSEVRRRNAIAGLADEASAARTGDARPDELTFRGQLRQQLGAALTRLPHDLRVVFVLCDIEEIAGVEVAQVLGLREGTVWRRLHEARKLLRARLEDCQ
jgi:RNA polymerase sigma-70 factor (ECF subfamily)